MNITTLRKMYVEVCASHESIKLIIDQMMNVNVRYVLFTKDMAVSAANNMTDYNQSWDDEDEYLDNFMKFVGTKIPLFSEAEDIPIFFSTTLQNNSVVMGRNICFAIANIRNICSKHGIPDWKETAISDSSEPTKTNWLHEELNIIETSYKSRINKAWHDLRDINTYVKYLQNNTSSLPKFIQSSVIGLFGTADHGPYEYSESDFKHQPHDGGFKVLTGRWLAPFIGVEKADLVEKSLKTIFDLSEPKKDHPPTLNGFSSHTTNAINLFKD